MKFAVKVVISSWLCALLIYFQYSEAAFFYCDFPTQIREVNFPEQARPTGNLLFLGTTLQVFPARGANSFRKVIATFQSVIARALYLSEDSLRQINLLAVTLFIGNNRELHSLHNNILLVSKILLLPSRCIAG